MHTDFCSKKNEILFITIWFAKVNIWNRINGNVTTLCGECLKAMSLTTELNRTWLYVATDIGDRGQCHTSVPLCVDFFQRTGTKQTVPTKPSSGVFTIIYEYKQAPPSFAIIRTWFNRPPLNGIKLGQDTMSMGLALWELFFYVSHSESKKCIYLLPFIH